MAMVLACSPNPQGDKYRNIMVNLSRSIVGSCLVLEELACWNRTPPPQNMACLCPSCGKREGRNMGDVGTIIKICREKQLKMVVVVMVMALSLLLPHHHHHHHLYHHHNCHLHHLAITHLPHHHHLLTTTTTMLPPTKATMHSTTTYLPPPCCASQVQHTCLHLHHYTTTPQILKSRHEEVETKQVC